MPYAPNFLELHKKGESYLTEEEKEVLSKWLLTNEAILANSTQGKFFSQFLHGQSCSEIWEANKAFSYGAILHARIAGQWDRRLEEHQKSLLDKTQKRAGQISLEMVRSVLDVIGAQSKVMSDKVKKFYETNDESDLPFSIRSTKGLKELIELYQLLMKGGETPKTISGEISPEIKDNETIIVESINTTTELSHSESLIKLLEDKEKK